MLKNYLTIALRNLRRQKVYSFINIAGLAIGMAVVLLIGLYIRDELSYDRFHEKGDRIVRLASVMGDLGPVATSSPVSAARIAETFPQVEAMTRFINEKVVFRHGSELHSENRFFYVDPAVFRIFSFPLVAGDPATALREPGTVVLTTSTARRYFGISSVLGQSLVTNDGQTFRITGIVQDPPPHSHLKFDFLASLNTIKTLDPWGHWGYTYLLLNSPEDAGVLQTGLDRLTARARNDEAYWNSLVATFGYAVKDQAFLVQPLHRIHLFSQIRGETESGGSIRMLYVFGIVALFILLIACINYMNLATARSAQRTREVGIRKVVGAHRGQLARQFLTESLLLSALALGLALILARLALPAFNQLVGREITFLLDGWLLTLLGIVLAVTGVVSGSYPALFLTRLRPARILRTGTPSPSGGRLRQGLVVFQFTITVILVICTLAVLQQLDFMEHKPLGYNTKQVLQVPLRGKLGTQADAFKAEVMRLPDVLHTSLSSGLPGVNSMFTVLDHKGEKKEVYYLRADADYLETIGLTLVSGQNFEPGRLADSSSVIINETAARFLGITDADLGRPGLLPHDMRKSVIGIVRDFHAMSLHRPIDPMIIERERKKTPEALIVQFRSERMARTLNALKRVWHTFAPDEPFEYVAVDQVLADYYLAEQRLARIFGYFSLLAVLIACLGLLGLAAFAAESRTKEIGIRKTMGASVGSLVALLSSDYLKLVLVAFVIAVPVAYYAMSRWLEGFAYRIELGPGVFLLAGALALVVALATVATQAIRAALSDPVKSLRYE